MRSPTDGPRIPARHHTRTEHTPPPVCGNCASPDLPRNVYWPSPDPARLRIIHWCSDCHTCSHDHHDRCDAFTLYQWGDAA